MARRNGRPLPPLDWWPELFGPGRPIDTERFGPGLRKLNETVEYSPNHMTPLKRLGQPFEVAHAVLFLASDEASYVTGHTLAVTGGR